MGFRIGPLRATRGLTRDLGAILADLGAHIRCPMPLPARNTGAVVRKSVNGVYQYSDRTSTVGEVVPYVLVEAYCCAVRALLSAP